MDIDKEARSVKNHKQAPLPCEETLLCAAQQGDELAIESLLSHYDKMLHYIAGGYYLQDGDQDDLIQEARIGFMDGIQSYDPSKGMSFKNFAWLCVTRHLASRVKKSLRKKHMVLNQALSIDESPSEEGLSPAESFSMADRDAHGVLSTPENDVVAKESFLELGSLMESALSKLEYSVLVLRYAGLSYEDITTYLGLETKSVDNTIQRIRKKLSLTHVKAILQA